MDDSYTEKKVIKSFALWRGLPGLGKVCGSYPHNVVHWRSFHIVFLSYTIAVAVVVHSIIHLIGCL